MRNGKIVSWLVVVYWVALINLGPSVHLSHCLGCHCEAAEHSRNSSAEVEICRHCIQSANGEIRLGKTGSVEYADESVVCNFFENDNVALAHFEFANFGQWFCQRHDYLLSQVNFIQGGDSVALS